MKQDPVVTHPPAAGAPVQTSEPSAPNVPAAGSETGAPPKVVKPKPITRRERIEQALAAARTAIQAALKQLIAHGVADSDPKRLRIENEFEAARIALASGKPERDHLVEAKAGLGNAVTTLQFHKLPDAETAAAYAAAQKALETIAEPRAED